MSASSFTIGRVMSSFFDRLFRNNLIRILASGATWNAAGQSLRRAHKDKRARKHLLGLVLIVGFLVLVPVVGIAYLIFIVGTGAWLFLPFAILIVWWIRRGAREEFAPLNIAPTPEPLPWEPANEGWKLLHMYFAELALLYAVMVDRAGSERFLKERELPEGVEAISRRAHLNLLHSIGLWERMAAPDRELIMMPDGHWDWAKINQMAMEIEPLRLLRWILRIDFQLPLVGQQLSGDFAVAHELVSDPQRVLEGTELADEDLIRVARDAAQHYFVRCLAETITRGYHTPKDEQAVEWANEISESLSGLQNEDLLLGNKLVSEAAREQLIWATALAQKRSEFLTWVLSLLEAGHAPEAPLPCIYRKQEP